MRFERLRTGELVVGAGGILLAAFMFLVPWYGTGPVTVDGWNGLLHLRWLLLVTIIAALALIYFQAARPAPAIPVSLSVVVTTLAGLTTLALIYRVLINVPGPPGTSVKAGAYLGLASALAILVGGIVSMRQEGTAPRDAPGEIPTVRTRSPG